MANEKIFYNSGELVEHLKGKAATRKVLYHYTNLGAVLGILKSGFLRISSLKCLNDKTEIFYGDRVHRDNTFAFSLAHGTKENMALWGLYSIPWIEGVRLDFSTATMSKLLSGSAIYRIPKSGAGDYSEIENPGGLDISLAQIAYCADDGSERVKLRGLQLGEGFDVTNDSQLAGYIKRDAWQYENETRVRVYFDNADSLDCIAIKIPDEVYETLKITAAPWFKGNLAAILKHETGRTFAVRQSSFKDLVILRDHCYYCANKPFERQSSDHVYMPPEILV